MHDPCCMRGERDVYLLCVAKCMEAVLLAGCTSVEYYLLSEANAEYIQVLCFSA